eukprot:NODE_4868_length_757_cov_9.323446_g4069_i0.p4 GENE.NODE_4868_length_757_cov_9.323446_g4069_i0~~NODE_4868_length_757_cov_9.323446_g4069_i0.p4  ORF type:complete len:85 (+),score=25.15 NODE_4868_length_757_cov_9.323446_g4069_i0:438-692(+)
MSRQTRQKSEETRKKLQERIDALTAEKSKWLEEVGKLRQKLAVAESSNAAQAVEETVETSSSGPKLQSIRHVGGSELASLTAQK